MKKDILLPIGLSNFAELIQHRSNQHSPYTFVDKSLLIRDFLSASEEVSVVIRPRRFGKTLNLSMLEHFFAPDVNGVQTAGLFDGLKISQHPKTMAYQGKFPAIFLTFKTVKGGNYQSFYAGIRKEIAHLFKQHEDYLMLHSPKEEDKRLYKSIVEEKGTETDYKASLLLLSRLLYQASGEKVYLFLDEYDTPIHDAFIKGYYDECVQFMAGTL